MRRASVARTHPGCSNHGKCPALGTTFRKARGQSSTVARAAWPQGIGLPAPAITWVIVGLTTLLQRSTPAELQGRVYAAADAVITVPHDLDRTRGP